MITEQQAEQKSFLALLFGLYGQFKETDPLKKVRARAWERFLEMGLPTRKDEVFRYVQIHNFFLEPYEASYMTEVTKEQIESHVLPECRQQVLVFVNGSYHKELSCIDALPKQAVCTPLGDAMRTYGGFLNNQLSKAIKEEMDPFALLNTALHPDGLFIYLPPKLVVKTPIQILNVIDPQDAKLLVMPRVQLFAGAQSQVDLVSTHVVLSGGAYASNLVVDATIEDNAHVNYTQQSCHIADGIWHFDATRASLKRNSTLKSVNVTDGAGMVRHDYRVALTGEGGEVRLNGVSMLKGKKEAHSHILIEHQAPHCRSMQLFKNALNDFSKSSFEGKILVRQAAQKTEAFQLNNNLLLSDRAHADSKPNLEIFADDVKASHGATVGQLDQEQIFYMKTRGFSQTEATNMLVFGFCQEVIDLIKIPSVHDQMTRFANVWLE